LLCSYNLHGFNQGSLGIKELIATVQSEIIMVHELWLTTENLFKLNSLSDDYFVFGSSATIDGRLAIRLNTGPLVGRPFGGTAFIIGKKYISVTNCILGLLKIDILLLN